MFMLRYLPGLFAAAMLSVSAAQHALAQDRIEADLINVQGASIGKVVLTQARGGVLVSATADGIAAGAHGFHIHSVGRCEPQTGFKSAGGHLAGNDAHGYFDQNGYHPGDMPNVHVQGDGVLRVEVLNDRISLDRYNTNALIYDDGVVLGDDDGAALVIHAGADDYRSQPSGAAGARIACAVLAAPK